MNTKYEIVPIGNEFALIRHPSGLILFTAKTETEVRAYFMKNKRVIIYGTNWKFADSAVGTRPAG